MKTLELRRITTLVMFSILFAAGGSGRLQGAGGCDSVGRCRVYISNRPVPVRAQQTPVWCWAASLSMLFAYYGHDVPQAAIVSRYFGAAVPVTGSPLVMADALNTIWTDSNGKQFRVTSRITDKYAGTRYEITNEDILSALYNEKPVFYGDARHAMVLVQADYYRDFYTGLPVIVGGAAIDPWPLSLGFRQLRSNELIAMFAAVSDVQDIETTPPSVTITSHSNGQTVTSSSITLKGTASDSGSGNKGISSVTVNGVRANGDTASGAGVANWSRSLTLNRGVNRVDVTARDNSPNRNATTVTIQINYDIAPPRTMFTRVGVARRGSWMLDANGNGAWDGGDRSISLGQAGDLPLIGDWNGNGRAKAGVFRPDLGLWVLDYNGNGQWDGPPNDRFFFLGQNGDLPVVGDWNGDGRAKAGIFRPSQGLWVLDYNGNGQWDGPPSDRFFFLGQNGDLPVVGDWNGDTRAKAGVFRPSEGLWVLDYNGDGQWNGPPADRFFFLGQSADFPVIGDWNGDGRVKAGIFRPSQGLWVLDYNGNGQWDGPPSDRFFYLGQNGDLPVIGEWNGDKRAKAGIFRPGEGLWALDYNGNGLWDGPPADLSFFLGQFGDSPVVGIW